jgi:hypothetical protein
MMKFLCKGMKLFGKGKNGGIVQEAGAQLLTLGKLGGIDFKRIGYRTSEMIGTNMIPYAVPKLGISIEALKKSLK